MPLIVSGCTVRLPRPPRAAWAPPPSRHRGAAAGVVAFGEAGDDAVAALLHGARRGAAAVA
eukprot:gene13173-60586_t